MRLAIIGYGLMGKLIEKIALERGHSVDVIFSSLSSNYETLEQVDMVIDFSHAQAVMHTVEKCIEYKKNLVIGTTGWDKDLLQVQAKVQSSSIGVLYSPNFSFGVNMFFELVKKAASLLQEHYEVAITERHHKEKKDTPSGTALHLQELLSSQAPAISALRIGSSKGKHSVIFDSPVDMITLTHEAKSREGYALGAIQAAEWLKGKEGFFTQADLTTATLQNLVSRIGDDK